MLEKDGLHSIHLDGRPMRVPGGPALSLRSRALAEAIAGEWQNAGTASDGTLRLEDLGLTRLAATVQERIAPNPNAAAEALGRYAEADLLSYRAEAPSVLADRQRDRWDLWLAWASEKLGAVLVVTHGVMPVTQPLAAVSALQAAVRRSTPEALGGLGIIVPATGSLVLGLAVAHGALPPEDAHALAMLDEDFEAELWGQDEEAQKRRTSIAQDITEAATFITLTR